MTKCPTCKLEMESHSSAELMECCMKQVGENLPEGNKGICPNCQHPIEKHTDLQLAECTIAHLRSTDLEI